MKEQNKTKDELVKEILELRRRVSELEASEAKHRREKETLRSVHQELRTAPDAIQENISIMDLDFNLIAVNNVLIEAFGLPGREAVIGRKCYEVLKGRMGICPDCAVARAYQTGAPAVRVSTAADDARTKGRSYEVCAYPIMDGEGKLSGAVELARDITERKRLEESIRESEEKYRTLVETSHDMIFTIDLEGRFLFTNKAFEQNIGYSPEEIRGRTGFEFVHPEDLEAVRKRFNRLKQGSRQDNMEYRYRTKGGFYINILNNAAPIFDSRGNVVAALGIARDVTELKQSQEFLIESESRFRTVFNTAKDSIFIKDKMGRYQFVNSAMEKLFGMPASELIGKNDEELFGSEAGKHIAEIDGRALKGESVEDEDTKPVQGVLKTFHVVKVPMRDSAGKIVGLCGIARDITARKRMEDELREARDHLEARVNERTAELARTNEELRHQIADRERAEEALRVSNWAIESSSNAIGFADLEGQVTYVNRAFRELWGFDSEEEIVGKPIKEFWQTENEVAKTMEMLIRRNSWKGELRGKRKDGSPFEVEVSSSMVKDVSGRPVCMMAWFVDITQRKKARQELIAARARLQHLLTSGPAMIYSCKAEEPYGGTFLSDNVKAELGYEAREFVDDPKFWVDRIHPEDAGRILSEFSRVLKKGFHKTEYRFRHKDGTYRWMRDDARLVGDAEGKLLEIVGYWVDITRERRLEEELLRTQKLESLGVLAGGIAHDFNNMLTGILGNIGLAKLSGKLDTDVLELLAEAEGAAFRARSLTNQLLTFSRGGAPVRKTLCLAKLLRDTAIFALRGSNVRCELSISDDLHAVEADEGQIGQVINNLLINASQAMPEGGKVEVRARNVSVGAVDGLPLTAGEYVQIAVEDHGAGIPKDQFVKIFDPYFSTKAKGRGLGLAVTYSIIKGHGGHISAESHAGIGTTLTFYLPASKGDAVEKKGKDAGRAAGAGRILVMDDEEVIRNITRSIVIRMGYEAEVAADGAEAVEVYRKAKQTGKPFDAVIFDLTVPGGMGGKEAMARLLEIDPAAKGIVSSGYSNDPVLADFRKYGFSGIVEKPYQIETLGEVLQRVIRGSAE